MNDPAFFILPVVVVKGFTKRGYVCIPIITIITISSHFVHCTRKSVWCNSDTCTIRDTTMNSYYGFHRVANVPWYQVHTSVLASRYMKYYEMYHTHCPLPTHYSPLTVLTIMCTYYKYSYLHMTKATTGRVHTSSVVPVPVAQTRSRLNI